MPKVSVIIPVYNGEKTIRETVESVLNQTLSDFELIIIDDGSTDSTLDVLSTIKDSRLKVVSYSNAGVSASRNRGIELASGEYIAFLDADDFWTPDKLEFQVKALAANPQASVVYSWADCIDEANQLLGIDHHFTVNGNILTRLLVSNCIAGSASSVLARREVFVEVGNFDETLTHAEDWDMWLRLAARYEFVVVPIPQILYRITDTSASSDFIKQEAGSSQVIERAFKRVSESLQHLKSHAYANLYLYLATRILRGPPQRQKSLLAGKFIWRAFRKDPTILKQLKYISTLLFKIATAILLPPRQAQRLRAGIRAIAKWVCK